MKEQGGGCFWEEGRAGVCLNNKCRYFQLMPVHFEQRWGNCCLRAAKDGPLSLEVISEIFGVSEERIRQIEQRAIRKLALALMGWK